MTEGDRFALTDLRARKAELMRLICNVDVRNKYAYTYISSRQNELDIAIKQIEAKGVSDEATGSPSDM